MKDILIALAVGFLVFEIVEHVIFPLFWSVKHRKVRSVSGASGMLGKVGRVRHWQEREGKVFVNGELWSAVSPDALSPGDEAVVEHMEGLTLKVRAYKP